MLGLASHGWPFLASDGRLSADYWRPLAYPELCHGLAYFVHAVAGHGLVMADADPEAMASHGLAMVGVGWRGQPWAGNIRSSSDCSEIDRGGPEAGYGWRRGLFRPAMAGPLI